MSTQPDDPKRPEERLAPSDLVARLERTLAVQQEAMRSMATQMTLAEERERRRIATDLHDRVGQLLALARIAVDQALASPDPQAQREALELLAARLKGALEQTRTLEFDLNPPVLREFGLAAAFESLVEDHDGVAGARCTFADDGAEKPLPDEAQATLYRAGRELFLNAIKHSRAASIAVECRLEHGTVVVDVTDDGAGMPPDAHTRGYGLRSVAERVAALGGDLTFAPRDRGGTVAAVRLPVAGRRPRGEMSPAASAEGTGVIGDEQDLQERLAAAAAGAPAGGLPLTLCLLRPVGLDAYDRRRGYQAGDEVLRFLGATAVAVTAAGGGQVFRSGGDEFAILLPDTGGTVAYELALQIEIAFFEQIEMRELRLAGGIAVLPDHALDADGLLRAAGDALEWSKALGHGGVSLYAADLASAIDARRYVSRLSETAMLGMVRALLSALGARDRYTEDHCRRVATLAAELARAVGFSESGIRTLRSAALLHDVGYIAVAPAILAKPGPLDADERRAVERHAPIGEWILETSAPAEILPAVRSHHERWDGTGYPDGLRQTEIPLEARVLAVCDAYDAMSHIRPYREALDAVRCREELRRGAGGQFDPELAERLASLLESRDASPGPRPPT